MDPGVLSAAHFLYAADVIDREPLELVAMLAFEAEQAGHRPGPGTTSPKADDWVLLAECQVSRPGAGAAIFWAIQRDDLIAQRFGRAPAVVDWNPCAGPAQIQPRRTDLGGSGCLGWRAALGQRRTAR
ncbi:hypothetical protein [Rugosimonospora acidiphila]|uniref:hypothetical protein n=1 Tax=Rugosimonospora acidiphila TaxID=556531 RepID=UPI0031EB6F1C